MKPAPETITLEMIHSTLPSAVLCDALDALGRTRQSPRVQLAGMTGVSKLAGRCKTTLWGELFHNDPQTYELELQAVDSCQPGDIFIGAASGSTRGALWGELLTTAARNRGCAGAIIDGDIRDIAQMTAMQFPVFARGASPYDCLNGLRAVDIDVSVDIDGVAFAPGDLVVADADGVVVVPQDVEKQTLEAAWMKVHAENEVRQAIINGMGAAEAYRRYGVL